MRVRDFDRDSDYETAVSWWKARNYLVSPLFMLPPNGLVICDGDTPVAMGFLMRTDAGVAGPCHLASNPVAAGKIRHQALDLLLNSLVERAKELGHRVICAETNLEPLVDRYKRLGFAVSDSGVFTMMKVV